MYKTFIFLNTDSLNDYYSVAKSGYTGNKEVKTKSTTAMKGGSSFKLFSGEVGKNSDREVKEEIILTDSARFNELLDLMDENEDIKYLSEFNKEMWNETWENVYKRDIIEAEVSIEISQLYEKANVISKLKSDIEHFENLMGKSITKAGVNKNEFESLVSLIEKNASQEIPLICKSDVYENYKFIVYLPKKFLKLNPNELGGEATLIGKVKNIMKENEKLEVYSMFPEYEKIMNREARRKNKKQKEMEEHIDGPLMVIEALAIYR